MQSYLLPALADTHCHLDFDAFDADRADLLTRARQAGLLRILNPGVDLPSSQAAITLAAQQAEVFAAVGIHPNDILHAEKGLGAGESIDWTDDLLGKLESLAERPKVVAIGEIGLDYYREWTPAALQQKVFRAQLELAARHNLPVIIHSRQAMQDTLEILERWLADLEKAGSALARQPGVLHSFSGSLAEAQKAARLNFRIGITGPVTFRNAADLPEVVAALPLDRLLIETDAPFLTPAPYRGKRNEPAYVRLVAEKIAAIRHQPVEVVAAATFNNAQILFNW